MNLEQQLSQYAFFNQQPSSQNQQRQQVSFVSGSKQQKTEEWIYTRLDLHFNCSSFFFLHSRDRGCKCDVNIGKMNMDLDIARLESDLVHLCKNIIRFDLGI